MKKSLHVLMLASCLALYENQVQAQVLINEYSASNLSQFVDNHSDYNDWIELYNTGSSSFNLMGYYLSDDSLNNTKWAFPAGSTIAANGFLRVWASKRNESTGNIHHTNFTLKQTKNNSEFVVFSNPSGIIIDFRRLKDQKTKVGHSVGRVTNGASTWAVFTAPTPNASNNTATPYLRYADKPNASLTAGFYSGTQTVSLVTTEPSAEIHYTLDGTEPSLTSPLYTTPISITATKVLKAATFSTNSSILSSFVRFETYFINVSHTLPVVSIAAYQLSNLANGNGSLVPVGSFEYFDLQQQRKASTYGQFNKHGQDSWANSQRSLDFISRDEMGYNHSVEEQLFSTSTMDNYQRVILRAAGDDNYPADHHPDNLGSAHLRDAYVHNLSLSGNLDVDVRRGAKCIVYLNGNYWGVYDLRDNPDDHDNTEYYYGQDKYHLYMLKRWGNVWAEYGGTDAFTEWNALYSFIMNNNMSFAPNYQYVINRFDEKSLVDYVLINMFTVCSDWLNWNTCWWRGLDSTGTHLRWGYQLWDNDATFGHYINYTGIPNTNPDADPCDPETLNGSSDPDDHIGVLLKLRQNPTFNQYYIARQHDLWNTTFKCDNMLYQLDSTAAVIAPEMTQHAARWAGTYAEWSQNTQILRNFISQRCTDIIPGWLSCYNLNGPYDVTLISDPAGAGSIQLNSLIHSQLPWSGKYFGGMNTNLSALANPNYQFIVWSSNSQALLPNTGTVNVTTNLNASDTIIAHFLTTGVGELGSVHTSFASAYPTIFSDHLTLNYYITESNPVYLKLYSITGSEVAAFSAPIQNTTVGYHEVELDLSKSKLSNGVYFLNFRSGAHSEMIKLVYSE